MDRDVWRVLSAVIVMCATGLGQAADGTVAVDVKRKPTDAAWKAYETRTLDLLEGFRPGGDVRLDKYGGLIGETYEATGYFYPKRIGSRWWLIDPAGNRFIHVGVCSVSPGGSAFSRGFAEKRFGSDEKWAVWTNALLAEHGFNGTGAWCATETLRAAPLPPVYTLTWSFMGAFGRSKKLTHQQSGHLGYPDDVIPVFHPEFEAFCNRYAADAAKTSSDPHLLGHFSDNELPMPADLLDRSLKLDRSNVDLRYGYEQARVWLDGRRGKDAGPKDITEEDRKAFLYHAFERYFRITAGALRKHDANHLCLGSRLYGGALRKPEILRAAGKHLDVVAVNYYGAWTPDNQLMRMWVAESGRPFIVTEWYAKGADSGLANNTGAGWLVKTQADRGRFYQNFTLGLLESKLCVGWHWFKYRDNNPLDTSTDPSNRDSNKGIVSYDFEPYAPLLAAMRQLNEQVYPLVGFFDDR